MSPVPAMEYIRDPQEIYRQSFAAIEREVDFQGLDAGIKAVATRLIHCCGMVDIVNDLAGSNGAVEAGRDALEKGAAIFCDVEMVKAGIITRHLPAKNEIICALNDERTVDHAKKIGNTRSAAAVDFWQDEKLDGSVVVIGNAPTALFRLFERLDAAIAKPALIIGMPVGFVGAAESKQELSDNPRECHFLTLHGRRGGSALAAAALNGVVSGLATEGPKG